MVSRPVAAVDSISTGGNCGTNCSGQTPALCSRIDGCGDGLQRHGGCDPCGVSAHEPGRQRRLASGPEPTSRTTGKSFWHRLSRRPGGRNHSCRQSKPMSLPSGAPTWRRRTTTGRSGSTTIRRHRGHRSRLNRSRAGFLAWLRGGKCLHFLSEHFARMASGGVSKCRDVWGAAPWAKCSRGRFLGEATAFALPLIRLSLDSISGDAKATAARLRAVCLSRHNLSAIV